MNAKDVLGRAGEQAAVSYLEGCGFRILDRNWRSADGEIDIVAVERHTLVVCEVKTRSGTRFGTPLEAVGRAKRARLRRLAAQWLAAHGIRFDQIRIDVLGLLCDGGDGFLIKSPFRNNSRRYTAEITDGLIPALQRRGLARTEYTRSHLRDTLREF